MKIIGTVYANGVFCQEQCDKRLLANVKARGLPDLHRNDSMHLSHPQKGARFETAAR